MVKTIAVSIVGVLISSAVFAQEATVERPSAVFQDPCERGPLPHVRLINHKRTQFVNFLQDVRPSMPRATAETIAVEVCEDMRLVGYSDGLSERLNHLLKKHGY